MTTHKPLVIVSGQVQQLSDTLQTLLSTTALASLNIPHGAAPTSPINGDIWTTTGGVFVRVNGATVGPLIDSAGGGTGTVTTVSVVTANGVSGSVANPTTTPAITVTLGNITPVSVAASGNVTGANLGNVSALNLNGNGSTVLLGNGTFGTTGGSGTVNSGTTGQVAYYAGNGTAVSGESLSALMDSAIGSARGDITYRNATAWGVLAPSTAGFVLSTNGAGADPSWIAASSVTSSTDADIDLMYFGNGIDGNLTSSSGVTSITRDMYYNNVTLSGTAQLNVGSTASGCFRVLVNGTLDISSANASAIIVAGTNGGNGGNTTNALGGVAGLGYGNSGLNANAVNGGQGAQGGTGVGPQAGAITAGNCLVGGGSGAGGAGGAVGATAGGASRGAASITQSPGQASAWDIRNLTQNLMAISAGTWQRGSGGQGAPGGSAGAGDGTGSGGGGGGGGAGGGILYLAARTIARGTNMTSGIITAIGGNGGSGGPGQGGTNTGGGGGGAGGGGGWLYLIYRTLTGSTIANALDVTGGNGGAGGTARGTGVGGDGGGSGGGGRIQKFNLSAGTATYVEIGSAVAGNAHSGGTGGTAKTAAAQRADL